MKVVATALFLFVAALMAAQAAEKDVASGVSSEQLRGKWSGPWSSQRANGQMEIEVQRTENDRLNGRVKVSYAGRTNCSTGWEKLAGTQSGEKVMLQYDLGGSCGKVDATFSVAPDGSATGTWSNQYGSGGPLRLTKQ